MFLEYIGSPSQQVQLDLIMNVREQLCQEQKITSSLLMNAMESVGTDIFQNRESFKIFQFMIVELDVDIRHLTTFLQSRGQSITEDMRMWLDTVEKSKSGSQHL